MINKDNLGKDNTDLNRHGYSKDKGSNNKKIVTVNLSSLILDESDISLLDRGLTFVPTPKNLPVKSVLEHKDNLIRNVKLRSFFNKCTKLFNAKEKLFQDKSTWTPSTSLLNNEVVNSINEIENNTVNLIRGANKITRNNEIYIKLKDKPNLSVNELASLNKLRSNKNIIIKSADKGGATVIMDLDNYILEADRQLNDSNYYRILDEPIYMNNIPGIRAVLEKMKKDGFINSEQFKFLSGPDDPRQRIFYLLPKIHKDRTKWTIPDKMPEGRPIVSDVESESYRVSQWLEHYLTPLAIKHETYLKNTYDFVEKIRGKVVDQECYLITGDVSALYTNMLHERTIECVREILQKYPDQARPDKHILDLLSITLRNNDFRFNGKFYLQTCGTPMGKVYAPALANIYMLEFDEKAMTGFRIKPLFFFRFLDDIFSIFVGTKEDILEYENYLNSLIPGIKVTLEYNKCNINFLDTTIYKSTHDGLTTLQTKVYFKPTDTHQLLHMQSSHPKHTYKGILKSQLLRFKRLSSTWEDYTNTCKILFHSLKDRGYTWTLMRNMSKQIWFNQTTKTVHTGDSESSLQSNKELFPIIVNYNSFETNLAKGFKRVLSDNKQFDNFRLINAFKIHANLKRLLVRSELKPNNSVNNSLMINSARRCVNRFTLCGSTRCLTCKFHAYNCDSFTSSTFNANFYFSESYTCKTSNIIYLITCVKCNKQYIGETSRCLSDRLTDHRSCILNKKQTPVAIHFNEHGHSLTRDLKAITIEKITDTIDNTKTRRERELIWWERLGTRYPRGLNGLPLIYM